MHEKIDLLNEAFAAHEHLAPNPADVLDRANELARTYRRRRQVARAAGASVVGAGIVAGGIALPGRQWGSDSTGATAAQAASGSTLPLATMSAAHSQQGGPVPAPALRTPASSTEKAVDAFFAAGYDYADAVKLSSLWHETDLAKVKADAGQKLLDGQSLPVAPSGPADATGSSQGGTPAVADPALDPALDAYFAAGYTYADATTLGKLWHQSDLSKVKATAGQKLLDGETLPIAP